MLESATAKRMMGRGKYMRKGNGAFMELFFVKASFALCLILGTSQIFGADTIVLQPGSSIKVRPGVETIVSCQRSNSCFCASDTYNQWHLYLITPTENIPLSQFPFYPSLNACEQAKKLFPDCRG